MNRRRFFLLLLLGLLIGIVLFRSALHDHEGICRLICKRIPELRARFARRNSRIVGAPSGNVFPYFFRTAPARTT